MKAIKYWLWAIFHFSFWLQLGKYDKQWDKELDILLDKGVEPIPYRYQDGRYSPYVVMLAGKEVWVVNYPYGYGTIKYRRRPRRYNIYRLKQVEDKMLLSLSDEERAVKAEARKIKVD